MYSLPFVVVGILAGTEDEEEDAAADDDDVLPGSSVGGLFKDTGGAEELPSFFVPQGETVL